MRNHHNDRKEMDKECVKGLVKKNLLLRLNSWREGVILLIVAIAVAVASGNLIEYLTGLPVENEVLENFLDSMGSYIEAAVAAISAGFVVLQLRSGEKQEIHQADVEEANFILEYNSSFIENEKLTEIERYLECRLTGADYGVIKKLEDYRQDMVNYLVYLEGLASCIFSGVLKFERIDNLLAYRFFIAMNHIETQTIDLLPYASYYRGCFRLYEEWMAYRMTCNKYSEDENLEIPLLDTALCNHYGYEKYACPNMQLTADIKDNQLVFKAWIPKTGWVKLSLCSKESGEQYVQIQKSRRLEEPVYLSLLRRILKELIYAQERNNDLFENVIKFETFTDSKEVMARIQKLTENDGCDKIAGDEKVVKLYAAIKYTKEILMARELSKQGGLQFCQLENTSYLSDENAKEIAALIYDTDKHIFPDMFVNKTIATAILPKLFNSNRDEMFQKKNLFICKVGGRVMGVILWYRGLLDWSNAALKIEIIQHLAAHPEDTKKNQEKILENLENVTKEYVAKYSKDGDKQAPADIAILNVCTDPNVRGMKIASEMLQTFLAKHEEETFELCVLSENSSAIKLYTRNGFKQVHEEKAYSKKKDHMRLVMRRTNEGETNNAPLSPKVQNKFRCRCRKARTGCIR